MRTTAENRTLQCLGVGTIHWIRALPLTNITFRDPGNRSTVPDLYLDRAIAFAQAHETGLIWIDKECIYQEERDREVGIQAMDLVYGESKLSLGLLLATVETQWQFNCLSKLLSKDVFVKNPKVDKFKPKIKESDIHGIVEVLQIILSDERWKRSWIFQEDHCASV